MWTYTIGGGKQIKCLGNFLSHPILMVSKKYQELPSLISVMIPIQNHLHIQGSTTYLKDPIVTRKGLIQNVKLRIPQSQALIFKNLISLPLISFIFFINGNSQAYNFNTLIPFKISLINFSLESLAANCLVSSFSTNFPPIKFKGTKISRPMDPIRAAVPTSLYR